MSERLSYGRLFSSKGEPPEAEKRCARDLLLGSQDSDPFRYPGEASRSEREEERLVWSAEAERIFFEALTANQFPETCQEVQFRVVRPWMLSHKLRQRLICCCICYSESSSWLNYPCIKVL